jgi:hypothetical protein
VKGNSSSLLTTGIYGVVKFVVTIFYTGYLVDLVGRRLPLLIGASLQATAMLYLAIYLRFAGTNTQTVGGTPAVGIVGVVWINIYALGWSFGHSVACYVVASDVFPTRIMRLIPPPLWVRANTVWDSDRSTWRFVSPSTGSSITALPVRLPI